MTGLSLYGMFRDRPRWYIRWRGFCWLRSRFCPCCYSSPPAHDCPICLGGAYGADLNDMTQAWWREQWDERTQKIGHPAGKNRGQAVTPVWTAPAKLPSVADQECEVCGRVEVERIGDWDYCQRGHTYVGKRAER